MGHTIITNKGHLLKNNRHCEANVFCWMKQSKTDYFVMTCKLWTK